MVSFRNTKSSRLFSESKELSPRRVVRQPPLMWLPNIEFKRRHRPDWLVDRAANCSILQPAICRNKNWLLRKSSSVSMNEDEEVDADDLASQVETDRTRQKMRRDFAKFRRRLQERVQLLLSEKKKKDLCISLFFHIYCLCSRKQLTMSWDFFIEENLQEAYWSKYCWLILNCLLSAQRFFWWLSEMKW